MMRRPVLAAARLATACFAAVAAPASAQDRAADPASTVSGPAVSGPAVSGDDAAPAEEAIDLETVPATLMMRLEDMIAVEDAIAAGPLARIDRQEDLADPTRFRLNVPLYVSAIIHSGRDAWTVWINGHPFRPGDSNGLFDIIDVSPHTVLLAIPWGEGGTREISLAPHQTFVPRMGQVIEGRWG